MSYTFDNSDLFIDKLESFLKYEPLGRFFLRPRAESDQNVFS